MNRSLVFLLGAILLVAPTLAFADAYSCGGTGWSLCATTTGLSSSNSTGGMSKTNIYTWGFKSIVIPGGQSITSATIAFTAISNWDSAANRLDIDLLDSPGGTVNPGAGAGTVASGGVVSTTVVNSVSADVVSTLWNDDFLQANNKTPSGIGDFTTKLDSGVGGAYGMVAAGANHTVGAGTDNPDHAANDLGHALTGGQDNSFSTSAVNYTYTLSAADLTMLTSYITSGGDFAFGFNPDCHFFDTNATMQITFGSTGGGSGSVPEPMSIILLGTVGLLVTGKMRRKTSGNA